MLLFPFLRVRRGAVFLVAGDTFVLCVTGGTVRYAPFGGGLVQCTLPCLRVRHLNLMAGGAEVAAVAGGAAISLTLRRLSVLLEPISGVRGGLAAGVAGAAKLGGMAGSAVSRVPAPMMAPPVVEMRGWFVCCVTVLTGLSGVAAGANETTDHMTTDHMTTDY